MVQLYNYYNLKCIGKNEKVQNMAKTEDKVRVYAFTELVLSLSFTEVIKNEVLISLFIEFLIIGL